MPKLGLTMTEGTVSKWYKAEGERVEQGEILLEVSTDKITNEVEAPAGGVVRKILVEQGGSAGVTAPIAIIAEENEDIGVLLSESGAEVPESTAEPKAEAKPEKSRELNVEAGRGFIKASPAAKKYARDNGVDLSMVKGTGPEGRIVEKDVYAYLQDNRAKKVSPVAAKVAKEFGVDLESIDKESRIMKDDVLAAARKTIAAAEDRRVAPSGMRRVIAERMSQSWHTAPMVTLNIEVDASQLKSFRASLKDVCEAHGAKLSFNDIIIKICAKALMEYPMVNASFDGEEIILHGNANVGLAVALDGGLIVPNVKAAQTKSLLEIAAETDQLVEKAKNNRLTKDEISGGTFTVTNLGMFGITTFTPIINQPESAILGVNAMVDRPVVVNGEVVVRPIMNLSLTIDHRMIDGADGAKFLARVKEIMENPALLLL
ncbi:MAG: dihydrolipoamide acetyltransferase family protein [Bacillota bacterium]|nr:dihydrolipoamide acetyltransferase family protein [Bacillota bacterium]